MDVMKLKAGSETDALVATKVLQLPGVGYYGPPVSGPWHHINSRRFDSQSDAQQAYRQCHKELSSEERSWSIEPDDFEPELCSWREGWGPIVCGQYSSDIAAAWEVLEQTAKTDGFLGHLHETCRQMGYPALACMSAEDAALAICRAALIAEGDGARAT